MRAAHLVRYGPKAHIDHNGLVDDATGLFQVAFSNFGRVVGFHQGFSPIVFAMRAVFFQRAWCVRLSLIR